MSACYDRSVVNSVNAAEGVFDGGGTVPFLVPNGQKRGSCRSCLVFVVVVFKVLKLYYFITDRR